MFIYFIRTADFLLSNLYIMYYALFFLRTKTIHSGTTTYMPEIIHEFIEHSPVGFDHPLQYLYQLLRDEYIFNKNLPFPQSK